MPSIVVDDIVVEVPEIIIEVILEPHDLGIDVGGTLAALAAALKEVAALDVKLDQVMDAEIDVELIREVLADEVAVAAEDLNLSPSEGQAAVDLINDCQDAIIGGLNPSDTANMAILAALEFQDQLAAAASDALSQAMIDGDVSLAADLVGKVQHLAERADEVAELGRQDLLAITMESSAEACEAAQKIASEVDALIEEAALDGATESVALDDALAAEQARIAPDFESAADLRASAAAEADPATAQALEIDATLIEGLAAKAVLDAARARVDAIEDAEAAPQTWIDDMREEISQAQIGARTEIPEPEPIPTSGQAGRRAMQVEWYERILGGTSTGPDRTLAIAAFETFVQNGHMPSDTQVSAVAVQRTEPGRIQQAAMAHLGGHEAPHFEPEFTLADGRKFQPDYILPEGDTAYRMVDHKALLNAETSYYLSDAGAAKLSAMLAEHRKLAEDLAPNGCAGWLYTTTDPELARLVEGLIDVHDGKQVVQMI